MRIEPASVDQIREASHGGFVEISADVGGVAGELRRIDPNLKVRFAENGNPPFWAVYWESDDRRTAYLVTTVQAHRNLSGTWEGLDHRLVDRMREIDPQNGYDYAKALAKRDEETRKANKQRFRESTGEATEMAAWAARKDLGARYKGRTFVPRDIPGT